MEVTKELMKKIYEDGQLFGRHVDFEEYYKDEFEDEGPQT